MRTSPQGERYCRYPTCQSGCAGQSGRLGRGWQRAGGGRGSMRASQKDLPASQPSSHPDKRPPTHVLPQHVIGAKGVGYHKGTRRLGQLASRVPRRRGKQTLLGPRVPAQAPGQRVRPLDGCRAQPRTTCIAFKFDNPSSTGRTTGRKAGRQAAAAAGGAAGAPLSPLLPKPLGDWSVRCEDVLLRLWRLWRSAGGRRPRKAPALHRGGQQRVYASIEQASGRGQRRSPPGGQHVHRNQGNQQSRPGA